MATRAFIPGSNHHRGMTFLEVVFATALFGIVTAAIMGVFSFTVNAIAREQRLLACSEVAHRLIMEYMDDKTKMPDPNKTIEYGPQESKLKFRWEYREDPITLVEPRADVREKGRETPLRSDRFRQVTVHAWLAEGSGGSRIPDEMTPQITLTRMYDPMYLRNPDSFIHMILAEGSRDRFLKEMEGKGEALGNAPAPTRGNRVSVPSGRSGIRPGDAFQRTGPGSGRGQTRGIGRGRGREVSGGSGGKP